MKRKILIGILLPLALFWGGQAAGEVVDRIIALVNGDVITLSELEETGRKFFEQVRESSLPTEREEKLKKAREEVLNHLIENKLLEQEMKNRKIEIPDRDVEQAIEEIRQRNRLTENELKMVLAKDGMTYSMYQEKIRSDLGKMRLVNREIKSKIVIQEEDVRKVYQEKIQEFTVLLELKLQQVFLTVPRGASPEEIAAIQIKAKEIAARARKGEDFSELVRKYSQGPEARDGGVLGYFKHKELLPELEEATFKLQAGETSEVVQTPQGFHVLRVLERKGGEPKPFAEVQYSILDQMIQAEAETQFQKWLKNLKAKAYIEIRLS